MIRDAAAPSFDFGPEREVGRAEALAAFPEGPPAIRTPAQVEPFVAALGEDLAVRFLLNFGGAELHVPARPTPRGRLVAVLGESGAAALADVRDRIPRRIPLAKPWLARVLATRGFSTAEIARTLLSSDVTVRKWLSDR